jgi:hypothetical protein
MKHSRAAVIRRRRLATSVSVMAIIAVVVILITQLSSPSHSHARSPSAPAASTNAGDSTSASEMASLHRAIASFVAHRHGAISAAVYDRNSGALMLFHPKVRGRTASIVKADILETRLHQTGGHLSEDQRETATSMIENSNNDSATDLFDQDGGAPGLAAYDKLLGLRQTTPNSAWGLTTTSAADQVTLVRELLAHSTLLTNSARRFQRTLMRHVEADQRWGISGGVPKGVTFGNKNGWLPVTEDHNRWAVNSIGWVQGNGKSYVIAVITAHNATEDYGIDTIEAIAKRAWQHMTTVPSSSWSKHLPSSAGPRLTIHLPCSAPTRLMRCGRSRPTSRPAVAGSPTRAPRQPRRTPHCSPMHSPSPMSPLSSASIPLGCVTGWGRAGCWGSSGRVAGCCRLTSSAPTAFRYPVSSA